jgi:hypothetical protein
MIVSSASRRARKVAAQVDLLERVRQEIVAATARLLQPTGVLVPVRVFNDRKKRGRSRDWFSKPQPFL